MEMDKDLMLMYMQNCVRANSSIARSKILKNDQIFSLKQTNS